MVPIALAQLDVFEVEGVECASVGVYEICDLGGVHDGVFELHGLQAGELKGLGSITVVAEGGVGVVVVLNG